MAEAVGVVAAGVAFAEVVVKISSHVFTLKHMWDEFKEVPETVRLLVGDIELLSLVLQDMEADIQRLSIDGVSDVDSIGNLIIVTCRGALDVLSVSAEEMAQELLAAKRLKRAIFKAKFVLKKDFWSKTEQRLRRVVWMLGVAQQHWVMNNQSRFIPDPEIPYEASQPQSFELEATAQQTQSISNTTDLIQSSDVLCNKQRAKMAKNHLGFWLFGSIAVDSIRSSSDTTLGNPSDRHYLQITPPSWLTRKSWNILYSLSSSGYTINLRTYSVVPFDSTVMECARRGDIAGLLRLFDMKVASPFDIRDDGTGLLEEAVRHCQPQAIPTMIYWGLDFSKCFDPKSKSNALYKLMFRLSNGSSADVHRIHELAVENRAYDAYADEWLLPANDFWRDQQAPNPTYSISMSRVFVESSPKAAGLFISHLRPGHYQLPAIDRVRSLTRFPIQADDLRYMLWADGEIKSEDIQALDKAEFPLMKFIASWYNDMCFYEEDEWRRQPWRQFTKAVARSTALLHSCIGEKAIHNTTSAWYIYPGTALHTVIKGHHWGWTKEEPGFLLTLSRWRRRTERKVQDWLGDLQEGGVDLNEYGRQEKQLFLETEWIRSLRYYFSAIESVEVQCRLATFTYGPEPKDWRFTWETDWEGFVGDFWDMIDDPTINMAGAWVD